MVLGWIGAILIGLSLGLMGSGGSILTVPVLVYLFGQDEKVAIAGSLAIVGTIALAGGLGYLRAKLIDWKTVWLFGLPGMLGTYIGAWLAAYIPGIVQLVLFSLVMVAAAFMMMKKSKLQATDHERHTVKITIDGLIVGIITGIVGVGGGFLIVPALVLMGGLNMRNAVATSLIIIAMKSYSGFYKYLDVLAQQNLQLDWQTLSLVTIIGIVGTFIGNYLCNKIPQTQLKKYFAYFLLVMASFILYKELPEVIQLLT
ncbi:MAG TPA: sulfite exporter TauE/SafE family protein [Oceanospirillales bacterium]|nr:sulfite exporter TauE/SafE family protein [Oceanospirillales bacterium]